MPTATSIDGVLELVQIETHKEPTQAEKELNTYIGEIQKEQYLKGDAVTPSLALARQFLINEVVRYRALVQITANGYKAVIEKIGEKKSEPSERPHIRISERGRSYRLGLRRSQTNYVGNISF